MEKFSTFYTLKNFEDQLASDNDVLAYFNNGQEGLAVSTLYCRYHKLFKSYIAKFVMFNNHDSESFILEAIVAALKSYNLKKAKGTLKNYVVVVIKNKFREEAQRTMAKNRDWFFGDKSTFVGYTNSSEEEKGLEDYYGGIEDDYKFEVLSDLENVTMSENQRKYCLIVMENPEGITDSEIAQELGISRAGVLSIKKSLKKKLESY